MYDWANSVYNLVITTTFFPIYFLASTQSIISKARISPSWAGHSITARCTAFALAAAYLIISILYPVLTSIADNRGNKKSFMRSSAIWALPAAACCISSTGRTLVGGSAVLCSPAWVCRQPGLLQCLSAGDRRAGRPGCRKRERLFLRIYRERDHASARVWTRARASPEATFRSG